MYAYAEISNVVYFVYFPSVEFAVISLILVVSFKCLRTHMKQCVLNKCCENKDLFVGTGI